MSKWQITPSRITTAGYADTKPLDTNATDAGRNRNRRIEIFLLEGDMNTAMNTLNDASKKSNDTLGGGEF